MAVETFNGTRLRAAVIGTGAISEEHLKFLSASPGVELVGVCDLSPSLATYAVTRFNAGRPYTNSADLLRETKPDVVHVLTPPQTHMALAADCLNAGAHVIVEKPVAPSNRELHELRSLAESRGRRLIEDHNYRFNEPILEIERLLQDGQLGDVREVEVRMSLAILEEGGRFSDRNIPHPAHRMPAGAIHDFITHLCYLTLRFMPSWDRLRVAWSKYGDSPLFKYDDLDAILIGGGIHSRIRFSAHTAPDAFTVTVRGSKGWAEGDLFFAHVRAGMKRSVGKQLSPLANQFIGGYGLVRASVSGFRNKVMQKTPYEGLATFLDRTYKALHDGTEPPVSFDDMDRTSKLIDALLNEQNRM